MYPMNVFLTTTFKVVFDLHEECEIYREITTILRPVTCLIGILIFDLHLYISHAINGFRNNIFRERCNIYQIYVCL